jgi:hypothetical protein
MEEVLITKEEIKELILEHINELVGDTSVARQLDTALRAHNHKEYPTREEYNALKNEVQRLIELVGDTSVSEQINKALNG